jgi:hypothetical protein
MVTKKDAPLWSVGGVAKGTVFFFLSLALGLFCSRGCI